MNLFKETYCLIMLLAVHTTTSALAEGAAGQGVPLPPGSSWLGTVMCGPDKWDASIRVDARDNRIAELLANIEQQTKTIRVTLSPRAHPGGFDMTPVDSSDASIPFGVASGTVRTVDADGVQRQIISWRPLDGPYPKCRVAMRLSPTVISELTPATMQGTMKLFGFTINGPLEVPTCRITTQQVRKCSPSGLSCWNEAVRVQEPLPVCYVPDRSHVQFSAQNQPAWANGPIGVRLDRQNRVAHVEFQAANGSEVLRQLYAAFGPPARIDSRDRSQAALATCLVVSGVVDCVQTQNARDWTEYTQVWRSSAVEARFDEGSNRAIVMSLTPR